MRVLSLYDDNKGSGWSLVLRPGEPDYTELLEEVKKLRLELAEARQQAQDNWDSLEDVCIGTKLQCAACGQLKPCQCDT